MLAPSLTLHINSKEALPDSRDRLAVRSIRNSADAGSNLIGRGDLYSFRAHKQGTTAG